MNWQDMINDGFSRVLEVVEPAFEGLKPADIDRLPKPDCNSMGWIMWHLTRGQDAQIADLAGWEQLWIKDEWYAKFARAKDADDTGYDHTSEQVAAFKSPPRKVLLDYYKASAEAAKRYLAGLKPADLDVQLKESWFNPPPTIGVRIISILADCLEHAGEISYVRGLLGGKGWAD